MKSKTAQAGWSLSSIIAVILSWALNHSLGYAIVHFFCGWMYLIYLAIWRSGDASAVINSILSAAA